MTRREEIARYAGEGEESVYKSTTILALPAQEPGELVKRITPAWRREIPHAVLAWMDEAASALTDQAAEIARLNAVCAGYATDNLQLFGRATEAEAERDDYKRKLDEAVKALEEIAEKRFRFGDISVERMNMWFNCRARAALTEGK